MSRAIDLTNDPSSRFQVYKPRRKSSQGLRSSFSAQDVSAPIADQIAKKGKLSHAKDKSTSPSKKSLKASDEPRLSVDINQIRASPSQFVKSS